MRKNIYIKASLVMIVGWLYGLSLPAQPLKHEFSVYAGGGPSPMGYRSIVGEDRSGFRMLGGIGYSWFPSENFGFTTGAELGYYKSQLFFDSLTVKHQMTDPEGSLYEFRMFTNRYRERQDSYFLQIPLMIQYQTSHETRKFYIAGGSKVAIHLRTNYETNPSLMRNSGYYADEDYEYTSQTFMDFGTFSKKGEKGKLGVSTGILASLETGVRWQLPDDFALYTGLYADYGFNLNTNSILFSGYHQKNLTTLFEEKRIPLAVGLKVKLAFGNGDAKKKRNIHAGDIEPDIEGDIDIIKKKDIVPVMEKPVANTVKKEDIRKEKPEKGKDRTAEYNAMKEKIQLPVSGYSPNETALSEEKKRELDAKIGLIRDLQKSRQDLQIVCEGHTDDTGSDELNTQIGMKRAEAVRTYLIEQGLDGEQISTISKGKTEPLFSNNSEDDRRKNRRVKLVIQ